jgi:acyl-CoA thioesterase FadM
MELNKVDFRHRRRVRWSESCATGEIHFCQWLRYCEEAEYAFLRTRGLGVMLSDEKGLIGFPRISFGLDILQTARPGDAIEVQLALQTNDGKQLGYALEVSRDGELLVAARYAVACCRFPPDAEPYAILIPEWVLARLPPARD